MRLSLLAIAMLVACLTAPALVQAETLAIENGVSDNYKASYNADPSVRELRTWLSFDRIHAGGTTWRPAVPGVVSLASPLAVSSADGRSGAIAVSLLSGSASTASLRFDPDGRWGPLLTVSSIPIRLQLALSSGGSVLATGVADYRPSTFSGTGSTIERNGPGGRWLVGGRALRTDWESTNATGVISAFVPAPPAITRVRMPVSVRARPVLIRVTGQAYNGATVRYVRARVGNGKYGPWRTAGAAYRVLLPKANGRSKVRIQIQDTLGQLSAVNTRFVRCACR